MFPVTDAIYIELGEGAEEGRGVLVVGTVPQEGAARRQETADDMRAAIDWAEKENVRKVQRTRSVILMTSPLAQLATVNTSKGVYEPNFSG